MRQQAGGQGPPYFMVVVCVLSSVTVIVVSRYGRSVTSFCFWSICIRRPAFAENEIVPLCWCSLIVVFDPGPGCALAVMAILASNFSSIFSRRYVVSSFN